MRTSFLYSLFWQLQKTIHEGYQLFFLRKTTTTTIISAVIPTITTITVNAGKSEEPLFPHKLVCVSTIADTAVSDWVVAESVMVVCSLCSTHTPVCLSK
jgi:hypothetical protein